LAAFWDCDLVKEYQSFDETTDDRLFRKICDHVVPPKGSFWGEDLPSVEPQGGSGSQSKHEFTMEELSEMFITEDPSPDYIAYFDELRSIDYDTSIAVKACFIRVYHILVTGYTRPSTESEIVRVFRELNVFDTVRLQMNDDNGFTLDYLFIDTIIQSVFSNCSPKSTFSKYVESSRTLLKDLYERFKSSISFLSNLVWESYTFCLSYLIGVGFEASLAYSEYGSLACLTKVLEHSWRPALIVVTAGLLIKGVCYMFQSPETPGVVAESDIRSNRVVRVRVPRTPNVNAQSDVKHDRIVRTRVTRIQSQSLANTNTNMIDVMRSVAKRNMFEMWVPVGNDIDNTKGTHNLNGFALGIVGRCVMMPFHFMSQVAHYLKTDIYNADDIVQFVKVSSPGIEHVITVKDLVSSWKVTQLGDGVDLTIIAIPGLQPCHDIRHLFATEKQIDLYKQVDSVLFMPFKGMKECWPVISRRVDQFQHVENDVFHKYTVKRSYKYRAHTSGGDCGSMLFANDKFHGSVIIGMHVAGSTQEHLGISTVLSIDIVDALLKDIDNTYKYVDQLNLEIDPLVEDLDNMEVIGAVKQSLGSRSSGKSKLVKTPLYEAWGPAKMAPSHLKPFIDPDGNLVSPMEIARSKYCRPPVYIPNAMLIEARDSLQDHLRRNSGNSVEPIVLDFETAVLGDRSPYFSSIPRVTSAGFPYNTYPGKKTKERFFGSELEYDMKNPECALLKEKCLEIIRQAKLGVRNTHVFVDFGKDEKRKIDKVNKGNIRLVSGGPVELLIVSRMYFGSFQKWMIMNGIENGTSIAVTEYSDDWDLIARKLLCFGEKSSNIGAGDYKNFDMCEQPNIHWKILDIINDWYGNNEDNYVRAILWYEVVNSLHLSGCTLMQWPSSLPSGHPLTPFINDLYNHMIFRLGWIEIFGSVVDFNTSTYLITKGDDNVYSVHPKFKVKFNEAALQISFKKFGMDYTPEDKDLYYFSSNMRNIDEVTFLKRRFVYDSNHKRYIAPLDLDSILESPYWSRSGATMVNDLEFSLVRMFEELSLHPQEIFEKYKKAVLHAVKEHPEIRTPSNTNFASLRRDVLTRNYIVVYNPQSWLQRSLHEYYDENGERLLAGGRGWAIEPYCQDNLVASPQSSRSHNFGKTLASVSFSKFASETITKAPHDVTEASNLGQEAGGSFVPTRTADSSESFPATSTTRSTNDAAAPKTTITAFKDVDSSILTGPETGASQEVRNFLGKPQLIASGVFSTTDTIPINLVSGLFPADIIANFPVWKNKLSGNLAFRGKTVFTLQVNANRFQQGRYIFAWIPSGGSNDVTAPFSLWTQMHSANLCQFTQLPHVEIDLNCDTQAVLEVPLINNTGWTPLTSFIGGNYKNGVYMLRPYSPLVAPTGSTTANWLLYVHFEDVEFKMPVVPQAGGTRTKVIRRSTPEKSEQEPGIISGFLVKAQTAANILTAVPLLSSIAAPASWALGIAAKVASTFGWGKPHDYSNTNRVSRYIMPRYNNADTMDTGTKLSVFDSNAIEETAFAGTDLDELSIGYIVSIPAWFKTISWAETNVEGTLIGSFDMTPHVYAIQSIRGVNTINFPTPLAWVSNFFSLWRGSFKLTFKLVKTEFHTGRLQVSFYPAEYGNGNNVPAVPSILDTAFLHREIIDIRYGNEFSVMIPYTSLLPYRDVFGNGRNMGYTYLHVLNPLVAPSSVSSTVTILCEISGGPDFEFAYPRTLDNRPVAVVVPQSGGSENICEIVSTEIGNSKLEDTLTPARLCIGERVLSLRSLIKRFNVLAGPINVPNFWFTFIPFSIPISYLPASNVEQGSELNGNVDVYSQISLCFALQRGSIRYKFLSTNPDANQTMFIRMSPIQTTVSGLYANGNFQDQTLPVLANQNYGNGDNNTFVHKGISGGLEVDFPYYGKSFSHPTAAVMTNSVAGTIVNYDFTNTAPGTVASIYYPLPAHSVSNIWRAAGEDFSLGLFVSVPGYVGWQNDFSS
jgi:hypothetical protein